MPRDTDLQIRRATLAEFVAKNSIYLDGEPLWVRDTKKLRIGDGVSHFVDLPDQAGGSTGGVAGFDYQMPVAQTTALIAHTLGRDPVAVQVLLNGQVCEEYSVSFPLPGQTVLVGFDVSISALIRLI